MNKWLGWVCSLLAVIGSSGGARILTFFPMPLKSHQVVLEPLVRELALRGHEVTSYTPFQMANPPENLKEVLLPNLMTEFQRTFSNSNNNKIQTNKKYNTNKFKF
jgi:hypothetical protein